MAEKRVKQPVKNGIAKVPVIMQMEALECGAASLAMILESSRHVVTSGFRVFPKGGSPCLFVHGSVHREDPSSVDQQ